MTKIIGSIFDKGTGHKIEAKVNVLGAAGNFIAPSDAILKIGPGSPFFYSDGEFQVGVGRGWVRIRVERGTEYVPAQIDLEIPSRGDVVIDVELERWSELSNLGWHPGNTHIHYNEKENQPDRRLTLDPRVEDLRMTAVSILKRWDLEYATNKYSPGVLTEFSSTNYYVQCGEENRHNCIGAHDVGYGHIMLLSIRNVVEPVSRGLLVDRFDPDYPPLIYACDDTHRQGGIVIWCHNGKGMEAPVAAALGKVDAYNLFDPSWNNREYDTYYKMLNTGIRLPVSTGSDWFISSANRVYAYTGDAFEYESWVQALKGGRTFITNGPSLLMLVNGESAGSEVEISPGGSLTTTVNWSSHYTISRVEIVFNGNVVAEESFPFGSRNGSMEKEIEVFSDGWVVSRISSSSRDSYNQPIFAHTSPVYIKTGVDAPELQTSAQWFDEHIERSLEWVTKKGKFYTDVQRREVVDLFRRGQQVYKNLSQSNLKIY